MKRVAIVGGGITGLSAAYYLEKTRRSGVPLEYSLFESGSRLGGVIRSERTADGFLFEAGPDSYLTAKPAATELAQEVGLANQLIHSKDHQRKTYILVNQRLIAMPEGMQLMVPTRPWPMITTPLFSVSTKLRMAREYLVPPRPLPLDQDESVAGFIARHFGQAVVQRLADPLLAGVYGGDSANLSARAVLPTLVQMEATHRSLVKGALRSRSTAPARPIFTSFRNGLQQLTNAVAAKLPAAAIHMDHAIQSLSHENGEWRLVSSGGRTATFTDVILALPAAVAARLVSGLNAELAGWLSGIHCASSATVALAFDSLPLPPGFGFLVPRGQGKRMIACTFVHNKFDHRAPENTVLLRAFLSSGLEMSDADLLKCVRLELSDILGIHTEPRAMRVQRWPHTMPQYEVGHLERVEKIERLVAALPGLRLTGNAYRGIGISDCVSGGRLAAEQIAAGH